MTPDLKFRTGVPEGFYTPSQDLLHAERYRKIRAMYVSEGVGTAIEFDLEIDNMAEVAA